MDSRVLFEASFSFHKAWLLLLILLIAFPCIIIHHIKKLKSVRGYRPRNALAGIIIGSLGTVFLLLVLALFIVPDQVKMYQSTVGAYERGDYKIAEGYIEQFQPAQKVGKRESFFIDGVEFAYYDNVVQFGYHQSSANGGIITGNGQHLKIGYTSYRHLGNVIVYIEQLP